MDVNQYVRHREDVIQRSSKQVQTYTTIVKKYRPMFMPNVNDIFEHCPDKTRLESEQENSYGVYGWCTIPSKTMVNMEYNEQSIIVPSSYDNHNRVGGSNFLQMDKDFHDIYKNYDGGIAINDVKGTWCYLYNRRDWTYFLEPFFDIKPNNDVYTWMKDTYPESTFSSLTSDHKNGVLFEPSTLGRNVDYDFGDIVKTCQFLAKYHHNENNLRVLSGEYLGRLSYDILKKLTGHFDDSNSNQEYDKGEKWIFNSTYGSAYPNMPATYRYPDYEWIDDFNKTGAYIDVNSSNPKYEYNLGHSHAIDDFDDESVWFYITMTSPIEEQEQVIEIEDIMPFVFWWSNRG